MSDYQCACRFNSKGERHGLVYVCLSHWQWLRLIDEAREAMKGDAQWSKLAGDVPSVAEFPLDAHPREKRTANSSSPQQFSTTGE